jgi:DNA-binding CsgD family transcriptional regulator
MVATSAESDPEGTAALHEQLRKATRWGRALSAEHVEVLRCVGAGMSLDETAAAVGRTRSTVYDQLRAATRELREMALESERAAAERVGRGRR